MLLVQHNVDQYYDAEKAQHRVVELSREGAAFMETHGRKPFLICWSETVLTLPYKGNRYYQSHTPIPFLEQSDIPVLTGAPLILEQNGPAIANGAILVRRGKIIAAYGKLKLIPFAEEIPLSDTKWMRRLMERFAGFSSGWTAGKEPVIMEIPGLRFGVPICFEDAFAGLCREFVKEGAELLVNLTNDSWSLTVSAEVQHLAAARFRAVENRRALVRSTNSGCTVLIDAEGRTRAELPLFTSAYLALDVPVQSGGPTIYLMMGDWFPVFCAVLLIMQAAALWMFPQVSPPSFFKEFLEK
jgi:apolipoprotein N-acyltransferase